MRGAYRGAQVGVESVGARLAIRRRRRWLWERFAPRVSQGRVWRAARPQCEGLRGGVEQAAQLLTSWAEGAVASWANGEGDGLEGPAGGLRELEVVN